MRIAFHKSGESHDRIYVNRDDGTEAGWRWPAGGPPHDLLHWTVESELGLEDGFWGLVAAGANFNFASAHEQVDPASRTLDDEQVAGLVEAETIVTTVTSAISIPGFSRDDAYETLKLPLERERFDAACDAAERTIEEWNALEPGKTLVVDR